MGPHPSLRILCYHAISDLGGTPVADYGTPPALFETQIRTLRSLGFRFMEPRDVEALVRGEMRPKSRSVLLTFDDCYRDLIDAAFPILERHDIRAMAFCVSGYLGKTNEWDTAKAPALPLAEAADLKRLQAAGWVIGAHTRSHPDLTTLEASRVAEEVGGSIADLEAEGLEAPRFLAYPYGFCDDGIVRTCRELGLAGAFTVTAGRYAAGQDPFRIPRIEVLRSHKRLKFLTTFLQAA